MWEFWLRAPDVAAAVDFVMIHILPYWEDFPIAAGQAAAHVNDIHKKMAACTREECLYRRDGLAEPGPHAGGRAAVASQSGSRHSGSLAYAARENYRVNVIEAYDAP